MSKVGPAYKVIRSYDRNNFDCFLRHCVDAATRYSHAVPEFYYAILMILLIFYDRIWYYYAPTNTNIGQINLCLLGFIDR